MAGLAGLSRAPAVLSPEWVMADLPGAGRVPAAAPPYPAPPATGDDLARLAREHWTTEAGHHIRDVTFTEDHATSRTRHGPINLATIRTAIINTIRGAGYLHIPEGRRDHTSPTEALRVHSLA